MSCIHSSEANAISNRAQSSDPGPDFGILSGSTPCLRFRRGTEAARRGDWLTKSILVALASVLIGLFPMPSSAQSTWQWFDQGRPTAQAFQASAVLNAAAADGLEPGDYRADSLRDALERAREGPELPAAAVDRLDAELTASMQHYLMDLHRGRIDPQQIRQDVKGLVPAPFDPVAYLSTALAQDRLPQAVREARPDGVLYADLRRALARYRTLSDHWAWENELPPLPGGMVAAGQPYQGVFRLAQRLIALGDLPADALIPEQYEGVLVEGVRAFQQRHGLLVDGVIGRDTMQQLQTRPARRVRQIELALERLRWTPLLEAPRMIVVNIPEFVLRAYEVRNRQADVQLQMKVIVGRAQRTPTPVMDGEIQHIEFSPYWNVPRSIVRSETLPRLRRDPAYFHQQGFEFVTPDGAVLATPSAANIQALERGELRIRQRPSPNNALGDIKFIFPNGQNIFLHHTPAVALFDRYRRDFSHGCIRVEDPLGLAQFILRDDAGWTPARIRQAMTRGTSQTIRLIHPVPILISYSTVVVKNDKVHFFPDLYGLDSVLDQALQQRVRAAPLLEPRQPTDEKTRPGPCQ